MAQSTCPAARCAWKTAGDYVSHPHHNAFGKIVGLVLDDVFVIGFWAKD